VSEDERARAARAALDARLTALFKQHPEARVSVILRGRLWWEPGELDAVEREAERQARLEQQEETRQLEARVVELLERGAASGAN
jgi:hypothetical protein